jgi:PTH1 family peptidyl-tRNA hydrolase
MLIDQIASESGVFLSQNRFGSLTARTRWQGYDVFLMKPKCYMNLSGGCVQQALSFFKTHEEELIVIFDDLDQAPGAVKTRVGGGHGGHNGMRDILDKTGLEKFYRVKIGIGKPEHKGATANWVLSKFTPPELEVLEKESFVIAKNRIIETMKQITKKNR